MLRALLALALVSLVGGCALLAQRVERPTAEVRGVAVTSVSMTGIDGEIALDIQNPNGFAVPLSSIDWQLSVGGHRAVTGRIELSQTIPARGTAPVRATLRVGVVDAAVVSAALARGERGYELDAKLTFSTRLGAIDVAVHGQGELGS
jgi:LEA14-like dessication related protein